MIYPGGGYFGEYFPSGTTPAEFQTELVEFIVVAAQSRWMAVAPQNRWFVVPESGRQTRDVSAEVRWFVVPPAGRQVES